MDSKGWIALDIDGTITLDKYSVPELVIDYLRQLSCAGWNIAIATGRTFCFAKRALEKFDFPFVLLPQNGSAALEMPSKKLLFKRYLSAKQIFKVEAAYQGLDTDFLIYGGYDNEDRCYWRPRRFSNKEDLAYIKALQDREAEPWEALEAFNLLEISEFPLIKCFGYPLQMKRLQEKLSVGPFQISRIRDSFHEEYFILLVTGQGVCKGDSLNEVFKLKGRGAHVIAAGDDENDISLLGVADIKIAMAHAPESLQQAATFIAPPTKDHGIIKALQMALRNVH